MRIAIATLLIALASCAGTTTRAPVIVIGWDGADWEYLRPRMAAGELPELSALLREGKGGTLRTIHPPLSPIVWTTMMTGRGPLDHGILDFTRFNPVTRVREPITSDERKVPAVWSLASAEGRSVAVFGMWATYPAEAVRGIVVSDRFLSFQGGSAAGGSGVVFPGERDAWARENLARVTGETPLATLPDPSRAEAWRRILVETAVYDDLAAAWYREHAPDLTVLYVQATDAVGHVFAPFRPPRRPGVRQDDVERYGAYPDRLYDEVDRRLGRWRKLARETGAFLVLVSDHGFAWGDDRPPPGTSDAAGTAGRWHRDLGIFVVAGPGIAASAEVGRGDVAQVAPTILALLSVRPTPEMPAPLAGLAVAGPPLARETPAAAPVREDAPDDEAIERLRSLGYVGGDEPAKAPAGASGGTRTAGSLSNEGLILEESGRRDDARRAYERALAVDPSHAATLWNLSRLTGDESTLRRALRAGSPDAAQAVLAHAKAKLQAGDCRGALVDLRLVSAAQPASAVAPAAEALALLCLDDKDGAREALRRSLALDPDQPALREMLDSLR